ncbi:MAG: serine/threonine protein kinase [Caldilinea sp. CFX5]|nr:serine/threonine protein kinase [Caldilinea sp. CFX5]
MHHPLLNANSIDDTPERYLQNSGQVFAVFNTQDSGNISYGVLVNDARYFVKTAGDPANPQPYLSHPQRVALLRNAVQLAQSVDHPALCRLYHVIESPQGPLLVYEWIDGELIGTPSARRADPASPYQRFRALPVAELLQALDVIYALHAYLAEKGWIAADFYDGCLLYNFSRQTLRIMDLDTYHQGAFTNTMGRMFGSSRFMAPEEFQLGALIDQRTTVFTMGRTAAVFLSDGTLERTPFRGKDALHAVMVQACQANRDQRFATMKDFYNAWRQAHNEE